MTRKYGITMAFLLFATAAQAGNLGLTWDFVDLAPGVPPFSYVVERDGVAWASVANLQDPDPNDPTRVSILATGLPPGGECIPNAWTVRAVNAAGASDPSMSISSIPRPAGPGGLGAINVLLNAGGVHQIMGDYLPTDVTVSVNGVPVDPLNVTRQSCQLVEIPTTQGTPFQVCVTNPALPNSPSCWNQPPPPPPTNVLPF